MLQRGQMGRRLRSFRLDRGLSQRALAGAAGISASYLNLIEHDRRRIGAALLAGLAKALDIDPEALTADTDTDQLEAAKTGIATPTEDADALVQRFPGWSAVITQQARKISRLEAQLSAVSDRMGHDPLLSGALHQVLSTVTSIRSTASILVEGAGDRDWEQRFHQNVHDDSVRLADVSQALVTYLESAPQTAAGDAVDRFFNEHDHHFARLEAGLTQPLPAFDAASLVVVEDRLRRYVDDVQALSLDALLAEVGAVGTDVLQLSQRLAVDVPLVMRRLASLPAMDELPAFGLLMCDAAGGIVYHKPVAGFDLVRTGGGCPNWPVFETLGQPGYLRRAVVALPEPNAPRLSVQAMSVVRPSMDADLPPRLEATMLVTADAPTAAPRPVGTTCAICRHAQCDARRRPTTQLL